MADTDAVGVLQALASLYQQIPFTYAFIGHCLFCATLVTDFQESFFLHYWITFMVACGGGLISGVILQIQDPSYDGMALLQDNSIAVIFTLCWWLMTYFPYGLVRRIHDVLPVRMTTRACLNFLRSYVMFNRVDLAVKYFPGVIAAPLILGTIAGCAGKFTMDIFKGGYGKCSVAQQDEASAPQFTLRSGFAMTLAYYVLVHVVHASPPHVAAGLATLLIGHGILSDLTAMPLDFTALPYQCCLGLCNIPVPNAPARLVAGKNAKKKKE